MAIFLISFAVFMLVMAGMAVGVLAGKAPIKGSCGGMGALGMDAACEICGGNPRRCEEETRGGGGDRKRESLYYPADDR